MTDMQTCAAPMSDAELTAFRESLRSGPPPHVTDGQAWRLLATLEAARRPVVVLTDDHQVCDEQLAEAVGQRDILQAVLERGLANATREDQSIHETCTPEDCWVTAAQAALAGTK